MQPSDDEPADPLRLIDSALQRYASPRKVPSREVVDMLLDLRSALVLETTLDSLRADLVGTRGRRRAWLPRHEPF